MKTFRQILAESKSIDVDDVRSIEDMPLSKARERAVELIQGSRTNDRKKAALVQNVKDKTRVNDIMSLLWNLILAGERMGTTTSGYSKAMREEAVYLGEELDFSDIQNLQKKIEKEFGFVTSIKKSDLGGETTYFMSIFGPKDTWKNNIALNSPLSMTLSIEQDEIEQTAFGYQLRNQGMKKFRKTRFKNTSEMEKKILDYLRKNEQKIALALEKGV